MTDPVTSNAAHGTSVVVGPASSVRDRVADALRADGAVVTVHDASVDAASARAAVAGSAPLGVLVVVPPPPPSGAVLNDAVAGWEQALESSLSPAFAFAQAAAADMRARGGSVVLVAWRGRGGATDSALHDAIVGLAKAMAVDLGPDRVRVNVVSAPAAKASAIPSLCRTIAFLGSERSSYITGGCLEIEGGQVTDHLPAVASSQIPRCAIVTGAGGRIGRAICLALAADGFAVGCWDLAQEAVEHTASLVRTAGGEAISQVVDVADLGAVRAMVAALGQELGPPGVVVSNAAVISLGHALEVSDGEWRRLMRVNLTGTFFTAAAGAQAIVAHGHGGVIVNVGSVAGVRPMRHRVHYCASKAGVHGLTAGMDRELGPRGVRVVAVAPKAVMSGMSTSWVSAADGTTLIDAGGWIGDQEQRDYVLRTLPVGRPGQPEDVGQLVAFLVSSGAEGIHGTTIGIDGGYLAGDPVTR